MLKLRFHDCLIDRFFDGARSKEGHTAPDRIKGKRFQRVKWKFFKTNKKNG